MDSQFNVGAARSSTPRAQILYINFWSRGRARLDHIVDHVGAEVVRVNRTSAETAFSLPRPDTVVIGFGKGARDAATFIANYRSSSWFRRVPLIALVESRDEGLLQLCMEWGCDDAILKPIRSHHLRGRIRLWAVRYRVREKEREFTDLAVRNFERAAAFSEIIVPLGVAMMAETNFDRLLEMILAEARSFCHADGGTIYLLREDHKLEFKIMVNESLGISYTSKNKLNAPVEPIELPPPDSVVIRTMAGHVALTGETVNVPDVYAQTKYDSGGVRAFDAKTRYRTQSILSIALRDYDDTIIGVLQLINAADPETKQIIAFDGLTQELIESLSRLAGQALDSYRRMARLKKEADALSITIDEQEKSKQVQAIATSTYFQSLKAKAMALREQSSAREMAEAK